jgi:crotonobetainyl-CoA:carnitine CoA-transferase CaiB-like acyl-CoA transferase
LNLQNLSALFVGRSDVLCYAASLLTAQGADVHINNHYRKGKWDVIVIEEPLILEGSAAIVELIYDSPIAHKTEVEFQQKAGWAALTDGNLITGKPASHLIGAHVVFYLLTAVMEGSWGMQQHIRLNVFSLLVSALEGARSSFYKDGVVRSVTGNRHHSLVPMTILQAQDKAVFVGAPSNAQWELLAAFAQIENRWPDERARQQDVEQIEKLLAQWISSQKAEELVPLMQAVRLPFSIVQHKEELMDCPHLHARRFYERQLPWQMTTIQQVAGEWCMSGWEGMRIVDLTAMWAGPYCTRLFADLGVEVIKIEAPFRPDGIRLNSQSSASFFEELNRNKYGVTLDLRNDGEQQIFLQLLERAHVLVNNFSPRVMQNLGFTNEVLVEAKADLVTASLSAYGQNGPYRDYVGYGPTIEAHSGLALPRLPGFSISDIAAGVHGAISIMSALLMKIQQNSAIAIDVSQYEVACMMHSEEVYELTDYWPLEQAFCYSNEAIVEGNWPQSARGAPMLGEHNHIYRRMYHDEFSNRNS